MEKYNVIPSGGIGYGITDGHATVSVYEDEHEAYTQCRILNLMHENLILKSKFEAAVKDIRRVALTCKHGGDCDFISAVTGRPDCMGCDDWEWRGLGA